jgi:hypothetical protein
MLFIYLFYGLDLLLRVGESVSFKFPATLNFLIKGEVVFIGIGVDIFGSNLYFGPLYSLIVRYVFPEPV